MSILKEAFKELELLDDTSFDLDDEDDTARLDKFLSDEGDTEHIEMVVDLDADSEEDLKDTYIGELLLYCPVCHQIHYAKEEDIVKDDEEESDLVNLGEECPNCKQVDGFEIKGQVGEYKPEGSEEETEETSEEETEVDFNATEENEDDDIEESLISRIVNGDTSRSMADYDVNENLRDLDDTDTTLNEGIGSLAAARNLKRYAKLDPSKMSKPDREKFQNTMSSWEKKAEKGATRKIGKPKTIVSTDASGNQTTRTDQEVRKTLTGKVLDKAREIKKSAETSRQAKADLLKKFGVNSFAELNKLFKDAGLKGEIKENLTKVLESLGFKNIKFGKPLTESEEKPALTRSPYKNIIGRYYNYSMNWDFLDIIASIIERIDFDDYKEAEDKYEYVDEEIDTELIYTEDQWTVLQYYVSSPSNLDGNSWTDAYSELCQDIISICDEIVSGEEVEESLNEAWSNDEVARKPLTESCENESVSKRDDIDADADDKKEKAKAEDEKAIDDADADRDDKLNESQSQEIGDAYDRLSKAFDIDIAELAYGENGFMKSKYPKGLPDFSGDIIYSNKYWAEFEDWCKEKGIDISYVSHIKKYCDENGIKYHFGRKEHDPRFLTLCIDGEYEFDKVNKLFNYLNTKLSICDAWHTATNTFELSLGYDTYKNDENVKDKLTVEESCKEQKPKCEKPSREDIKESYTNFDNYYINYVGGLGDNIYQEGFETYEEAKEQFDTLVHSYETYGVENTYALELIRIEDDEVIDYWESDEEYMSEVEESCKEEKCESNECKEDFDDLDEELFDKLINKYCTRVYENVKNYQTTKGFVDGNKIVLEGRLNFKSGKSTRTKFVFESKKDEKGKGQLIGLNESFSKSKKAFKVIGKVDGTKFISESLTYSYKAKVNNETKSIYGRIVNR